MRNLTAPNVRICEIFHGDGGGFNGEHPSGGNSQNNFPPLAHPVKSASLHNAVSSFADSAYGGSAKIISGSVVRTNRLQESGSVPSIILYCISGIRFSAFAIFRWITCRDFGSFSAKHISDAPRLAASNPIAPLPAHRSAKTSPDKSPRLSKNA